MSIARRTRSVVRGGVKVQRRIVVVQALFWPTIIAAGLTIGAVAFTIRRSAKRGEPRPIVADEPPVGDQLR
ncbi:Uncharacterised protein [Mycolicibacterium aurum]|uniref:Transmembrane protein n=1 Tax=Mycolicibacterium aurum TaxID=1791 RepID=A0A448IP58_MYCAU|nr:hypothetical protein [Mycolicibacterium aurum]VEG54215.1 Uncharacterised protein [Mycolicibacterium aurum]